MGLALPAGHPVRKAYVMQTGTLYRLIGIDYCQKHSFGYGFLSVSVLIDWFHIGVCVVVVVVVVSVLVVLSVLVCVVGVVCVWRVCGVVCA